MKQDAFAAAIRGELEAKEDRFLGPYAEKSSRGLRRRPEQREGHRTAFAVDTDRILHSRAYTRYIDKTQVFYMIANDHITHRVLHVQLVSKIARTIGRVLSLNEDLIESIALGHDIGHPPFGHDGEKILDSLGREHGLCSFQHNLQSVRFLECIERKGRGINLTLQTLDGILCHDGEVHDRSLRPQPGSSFADFDDKMRRKAENPALPLVPMTLEGCVVRFADTISYIGRDIEDAIELGLIKRKDIPTPCREVLGETNGTIVYTLVTDLLQNSRHGAVAFGQKISEALQQLKRFNYERIYFNPIIKKEANTIRDCYRCLFLSCLEQFHTQQAKGSFFAEYVTKMDPLYRETTSPVAIICDYLAGMTDAYFLKQASLLGCPIPLKH